jgi:23S rRNA (cytosine1962-C5)-methyltransferase
MVRSDPSQVRFLYLGRSVNPTSVDAGEIFLKPKRAQPFFNRHPWVFAGAIDRVVGEPADGASVVVRSSAGNFVARGLINSQSKIRVRLYSWDEKQLLDDDFFRERIRTAIRLRHDLLHLNPNPDAAYRVLFSEADGLSGLVVDRYGAWAAAQFTSLALATRREFLGRCLMEELGCRGIYLRTEKGIGKLEGVSLQDGLLCGEAPPPEIVVRERGIQIAVNLQEGQKTGYYLDQRENRAAVARYCPGKRMLDAFCYTGGFGLAAAQAGAAEVVCLDASEAALALVRRNAELNQFPQIETLKGDVFNATDALVASGRKFDVVVLDPPKFARDRSSIPDAMRGYRRLYDRGMNLVGPDGIVVLCCCSGLITADELEDLIGQVALKAGRDVQLLERHGAAADHPIATSCRETAYLKCLITRVR